MASRTFCASSHFDLRRCITCHLFFHRFKRKTVTSILFLPLGKWLFVLIRILNDDVDFIWIRLKVHVVKVLPLRLSPSTVQLYIIYQRTAHHHCNDVSNYSYLNESMICEWNCGIPRDILYQPSRSLRSSSQSLLQVPRVKTDFGRRAFSSAAPQIWNHIPATIKVSPSLDSFKRHLKTHYFTSP